MKRIRKNAQRGFTLMELMVVIVIVAILAAVAVPLYINYVNDARRTEAKGAIGAVVTAEQTYYQQHGTYVADTFDGTTTTHALNCDLSEATAHWSIAITVTGGGNGFTAVATGAGDCAGLTETYTYTHAAGGTFSP